MLSAADTQSKFESLSDVMRTRRTIALFNGEPVDKALVDDAIELACWAPNHRKTEPWRFVRLGPETVAKAIKLSAEQLAHTKGQDAANARIKQWSAIPGWLLVTCQQSSDPMLQEEDYAACSCAVQNLMLALWSRGIGSKWSTGDLIRNTAFLELVGVDPQVAKPIGMFWYGYPHAVPQQSRKPLSEVLRDLP